ncbi:MULTISPECIES: hypothetical protein [Streptomyces]|uniref:Uncharacterized protein n=1 Tax=Streptomyces virginiae TaxID=1961 RepID=A0ABZ1TPN3_STRVG|nr:hypothetical protein [Streptomyces virginiae]WTB26724.1 hypothetical protein OG253_37490 [Streptomyces virginiae]
MRRGLVVPVEGSLSGAAYKGGRPVTSGGLATDALHGSDAGQLTALGPAVAVPLGTAAGDGRGVLLLARAASERPTGPG